MEAIEYLRKELKIIANKFPNVNVRYGYDDIIDTHIVELLPLVEYNTNEELDKAWIPLSIDFIKKYADEEIAFVSSDSSLAIKNIIFEFNPVACTEAKIISEIFEELINNNLNYTFPTEIPNGIIMKGEGAIYLENPLVKVCKNDDPDLLNHYWNAA